MYFSFSSFHLFVHPLGNNAIAQLLYKVIISAKMKSCLPGLFVQLMVLLTFLLRGKIATGKGQWMTLESETNFKESMSLIDEEKIFVQKIVVY